MAEKERPSDASDEVAEAPHERLTDPVEVEETPKAPSRGWAPPKRGWPVTLLIIVLAVAGAALALYAWDLPPFSGGDQSTDNAYVRGQTTIISPQVNGYVREVLVQDYQRVKQGEVLVRIDDRIYRQRVEQAQAGVSTQNANLANSTQSQRQGAAQVEAQSAAVANAQAQVVRARADLARIQELAVDRSVSLRERDQAVATLRQAEAALRQAQAPRTIAEGQGRTGTGRPGGPETRGGRARAGPRPAQNHPAETRNPPPRRRTRR